MDGRQDGEQIRHTALDLANSIAKMIGIASAFRRESVLDTSDEKTPASEELSSCPD
jgi:hypothetical protein